MFAEWWGTIWSAIAASLPEAHRTVAVSNRVLEQALSNRLQVWVMLTDDKISAICTTSILTDEITREKDLHIYSLYAVGDNIAVKVWEKGMQVLRRYAKGGGCGRIIAKTNVSRVTDIVKALGGKVTDHVVRMEV